MNKRARWAGARALVVVIGLCSCANAVDGDEQGAIDLETAGGEVRSVVLELHTFITDTIQIDQLNGAAGDANLFSGVDPADGTASVNRPLGGSGSYIDWHDLGGNLENHRLLDLNGPDGKDTTSFPQSNECVNTSQVLTKMDITYVAAASNSDNVFLAVQRAANNGDAAYYWLFTHVEPDLLVGAAPCTAHQSRLMYTITGPDADGRGADLLVKGHFAPSDEPLIEVYRATGDGYVDAKTAIAYNTALWSLDPVGVGAVAINTTETEPGALGNGGVKNLTATGALKAELFAEASVPLDIFASGSSCGASYFGSVITRTSGSGGTSPDLKDLAGPARFNFGWTTGQAALTPMCGERVGFGIVEATGMDGASIANPACHWQFDDGTESFACDGTWDAAPGSHSATVTITDPANGCQAVAESLSVDVQQELAVSAALEGSCTGNTFTYDAQASGGSGSYGYDWSLSGPGIVTADTRSSSGTASVDAAGPYSATVTVTDLETGCQAEQTVSVGAYAALDVSPTLEGSCTGNTFAFDAAASGGSGGYGYSWSFAGPGAAAPATSASASGHVDVAAPGAYSGTVTITDPVTGCRAEKTVSVDVYDDLALTASLDGSCTGDTLAYRADALGGTGSYQYSWSFTGPGAAVPAGSASPSGSVAVAVPGTYSATVTLTDPSTGCQAERTLSVASYGELDVTAALDASCAGNTFAYQATVSGGTGNYGYSWSFAGPSAAAPAGSASSSGNVAVGSPGTYSGTLTISDATTGCQAARVLSIDVYDDVRVTATLGGSCAGSLSYAADASGGSGSYSYQWAFAGPGSVTPSATAGTASVGAGGAYTGSVIVTDVRPDGRVCTASDDDTAAVYFPLAVNLALGGSPEQCPAMTTDALTYRAIPSGGNGDYSLSWSGAACSGTSCTIDPDDGLFCGESALFVELSDSSALCPPVRSETETYAKVTVVTASDN